MSTNDFDIIRQALAWCREDRAVALATVMQTWGSAPRRVGAHMAITSEGMFVGSVSGGCIEGRVISAARELLETDAPEWGRLLEFGISNEQAWDVGLACGGRIEIWLEKILPDCLALVCRSIQQRQGCALYMGSDPMKAAVFVAHPHTHKTLPPQPEESSGLLRVYPPRRRLFIVGAVHIAQALIALLEILPFEIVLIDPRGIFLQPERWGSIERTDLYPDEYFEKIALCKRDAVVVLSHDPKIDDPALLSAVRSEVFYIGALGSRKTHAARCSRLYEQGCSQEQLQRINGPIGLDIGAKTPAEIAVAILAQIIATQD